MTTAGEVVEIRNGSDDYAIVIVQLLGQKRRLVSGNLARRIVCLTNEVFANSLKLGGSVTLRRDADGEYHIIDNSLVDEDGP